MSEQTQQAQKLQIKAKDETLAGQYINAAQVSHSKEEVTIDCMNLMPPHGQLLARLIMSPGNAKRIMLALQDNVQKYESQFGTVDISAAQPPQTENGFRVA